MGRVINLISLEDGEWDEFKKTHSKEKLYKVKRKEGIE